MRIKTEIVDDLHERSGVSKADIRQVLDSLRDSVYDHLRKDGEYVVPGLGTLAVTHREARKGRNPQTGEPMEIAASNSVRFKATRPMRDAVN